jgi:hypothetical protein
MENTRRSCPDCDAGLLRLDRRDFLKSTASGVAAVALAGSVPSVIGAAEPSAESSKPPETIVKLLYDSLSEQQKQKVCFDWDFVDNDRGLLRTRVANNWMITEPIINSDFYTPDQRQMVRDIMEGIIQPQWHEKIHKQLTDDAGGFGEDQSFAIFGQPGSDKFEFVLTGRHMTLRCDGNTIEHVAFGGPIFYGHDPYGLFNEDANHDGNVFWEQALAANRVYEMLDGKQRKLAEVAVTPREQLVGFRGRDGELPGIPVNELSSDQQEGVQKVLQKLIEPYRQSDQDEVVACLKAQGGLNQCHLAFFTDQDIGNDKVWDNWRLEGPSFVWHFRGSPHVHVWVNVASQPSVKLNA